MSAFLEGLLAGYGIAIPLGGISILIVNLALEKGFRPGFVAGIGTATVDMACATLAVFAGAAVAGLLSPYSLPLQIASGLALIAMGIYGLLLLRRKDRKEVEVGRMDRKGSWGIYARFIALTSLNPFTVAYFAALIIGKGASWSLSLGDSLLFIIGVTIASASWQTVLAVIGAVARTRLSPRFMSASIVVGNAIVVLLGVQMIITV